MSYPWQNPFMSMWLSSANKMMSGARGQATAAVKREAQQTGAAATAAAAQPFNEFWTHKLTHTPAIHRRTGGFRRVRAGTAGDLPVAGSNPKEFR